jgi:hypothetical protein
MQFSVHFIALAATIGLASASPSSVNGASYNNPTRGPSTAWFAGATSLPATQIASAAAAATKVPADATYILQAGGTAKATIHSDWSDFSKVRCITSPDLVSPSNIVNRELHMYGLPIWTSTVMELITSAR